jgi:N utilization substance protein B
MSDGVKDNAKAGPPSGPRKLKGRRRSAARLAAVQALYQLEMSDGDAEGVILEFATHRPGALLESGEDDAFMEIDKDMFSDIVRGAARMRGRIDAALSPVLPAGWPLNRLEKILRAILRAGVYELILRTDVPGTVIINEYVDIAHGFFAGDEPAMVNAVLDAVARRLRAEGGAPPPAA